MSLRVPDRQATMTSTDHIISALEAYIPEAMRVTGVPGLTIAVAVGPDVIWTAGFGLADVASDWHATADTPMRAGSMTKTYTALGVMQLVEAGFVGLDVPVAEYLTDLDLVNPLGPRAITVKDLLTFRSGLSEDMGDCGAGSQRSLRSFAAAALEHSTIAEYGGVIPRWTAPVGSRFQYSNLGIALLGLVIETANPEGLSYCAYIARRILAPLGMSASGVLGERDAAPSPPARIATGYAGFGPVRLTVPVPPPSAYPATGLVTTARDHARFLLALRGGGEYEHARVLSADGVATMIRPHVGLVEGVDIPSGWEYGLCVALKDRGTEWFNYGHGGGVAWGWWSEARVYPTMDLTVAVFTNHADMLAWHNPLVDDCAKLVCDAAAGVVLSGRLPGPEIRRSWGWKRSYFVGLLLAERTYGLLGIPEAFADEIVGDVLCTAALFECEGHHGQLCEDGFRAGVTAVAPSRASLRDMETMLEPGQLPLGRAELSLAYRALGGVGGVPIPLNFWPGVALEGEPGRGDANAGS